MLVLPCPPHITRRPPRGRWSRKGSSQGVEWRGNPALRNGCDMAGGFRCPPPRHDGNEQLVGCEPCHLYRGRGACFSCFFFASSCSLIRFCLLALSLSFWPLSPMARLLPTAASCPLEMSATIRLLNSLGLHFRILALHPAIPLLRVRAIAFGDTRSLLHFIARQSTERHNRHRIRSAAVALRRAESRCTASRKHPRSRRRRTAGNGGRAHSSVDDSGSRMGWAP